MSNEVPEGWKAERLGNVCYIKARIGWKGLAASEYTAEGPYLIAGKHIRSGKIDWSSCDHISIERYQESMEIALQNKDVILSKDGTIGTSALISDLKAEATINGTMMLLRSAEEHLDSGFLFQTLGSQPFKRFIHEKVSGSSIPHIFQRDMVGLNLLLPPVTEQKKIAAILTSVDEAIAATEALVAQTRRVKQGVLKHLLTRGIGHTRFKQTEIGEIPEGWEVVRLESLLADVETPMRSGPFGSALLKSELVDEGIPFLGIDNIHVERFVDSYRRFVTEEKYHSLKRYAVRLDDVVITIMGTVGRCCLIPKNVGKALSSKHIWTMSFDQKRYRPALVCWQLNYAEWVLSKFRATSQGGIMEAINSKTLRDLLLPLPPIEEQIEIEAALASFNAELDECQMELGSMQTLKSALMSDLLTGRKRVSLP